MKSIKAIILAVAAVVLSAVPASAGPFRIGPRLGTEVNSMRLDKTVFDNENRAGFTGGLMMEFTVPIINIGFDLSVMYVHRVSSSTLTGTPDPSISEILTNDNYRKRDYIEIPLNLKYKIGLPLIGKVFTPYLFTGPSFSILASKKAITDAYKNRSFDVAWNFGVGIQLFTHLQIGASYGLGLNKTVEAINKVTDTTINTSAIEGKNNYWTITAAWLF